jgi:pimeloyl-ACP methyl ester carboxylesterase
MEHGNKEIPKEGFNIELFSQEISNFIIEQEISPANILGYSMGGYAALHLSLNHPEHIKSIFTLATKFDWSEESTKREIKMLNPELMKEKIPAFVKTLEERHSSKWNEVVLQTAHMMKRLSDNPLTEKDFQKIEIPVRLAVGDRDRMVSVQETQSVFKLLKQGSLLVLPNTSHPFEKVNTERLAQELKIFFKNER